MRQPLFLTVHCVAGNNRDSLEGVVQMEKKTIPMETLVPLLQLQMEQGGQASLTVTGSSMRPMLVSYRDSVLLTPVNGQLHLGDVILYRRASGQYVLHRIIKQTEPMICCGDNQWQQEEVFASQVIACVSAFCRNGRQYAVLSARGRGFVFHRSSAEQSRFF